MIQDQFAVPLATLRLVSGGLACFSVWMDDDFGSHDTRITLATDAAQHPEVFAAAFNSGTPRLWSRCMRTLEFLHPNPDNL